MTRVLSSFIREDDGQDIIEYAFLAAFTFIWCTQLLSLSVRTS